MMLQTVLQSLRYMLDGRVPLLYKLIPIAIVAYILSPLDILPDVVPVLGSLDDFSLFVLGIDAFARAANGKVSAGKNTPRASHPK